MTLIDSNILIYAINRSSPKHKIAQSFLKASLGEFCLAQQNILEAVRVLTHPVYPHPMKLEHAISSVQGIVQGGEIISPMAETYPLWEELVKTYRIVADGIYDAYLVATMLINNVKEVATDNVKDFKQFPQIQVFNPFSKSN